MPTEPDTDSSEEKKRRDSAELKRVLPVWWGLKKAAKYIAPRTKKAAKYLINKGAEGTVYLGKKGIKGAKYIGYKTKKMYKEHKRIKEKKKSDIRRGKAMIITQAAKAKIAGDQLKSGNYSVARMFDDHDGNLDAFLSLKQQFPNINFEAFLVDKDNGNISRYH
jgi:uncharacterized protein (DUF2141 family)